MTEIDGATGRPAPTRVAHVLYILHGLAPFTAWMLAVVAIIVGMVNRDAVSGTWVESHYSYLSRTFWWGLLWIVLLSVATFIMVITIILIPLAWLLWAILFIWYLYRVVRGWLRLGDGKGAPS